MKQSYDLIGDIHGQAQELVELLRLLSYENINGIWQHPDRKAIFLGDFIDRGLFQKEVVDIVRPMVASGHALSVMGNHEYNAIAFNTRDKNDTHLRAHNIKNIKQHRAFLKAYRHNQEGYLETLAWFKTLPLWLDLNGLRVIHACWDSEHIDKVLDFQNGSNLLSDELLQASSRKDTWQYGAIETLLKGKEIPLPEGRFFYDKDKNKRHHIRIKWWDKSVNTYHSMFMGPDDARAHIPKDKVEGDHLVAYGKQEKPVFLGHYWMSGEIKPLTDNIACIDYSVAKEGGSLVAYRWDGERILEQSKFLSVKRG